MSLKVAQIFFQEKKINERLEARFLDFCYNAKSK